MSHEHDHGGTGRTVIVNLAVNVVLTLAKWTAFACSGSPSIFGEAAHSTADSLNPLLLWIGHSRGRRPGCPRHPAGHGRETYFWSLIAAIVMLLVGSFLTAWHGIGMIVSGEAPEFSPLSFGIMTFALLAVSFNVVLAWRRLRLERGDGALDKIKGSRNTVLLGILLENGVDALAVLFAYAGFGLYLLTGEPLWDAAFSLLIAALLAVSSLFLIGRNRSLITGEAAPAEIVEAVAAALRACPAVAEVASVTAVIRGPEEVHCRLRLRLDPEVFVRGWNEYQPRIPGMPGAAVRWTLEALARETAGIERTVRERVRDVASVEIELV